MRITRKVKIHFIPLAPIMISHQPKMGHASWVPYQWWSYVIKEQPLPIALIPNLVLGPAYMNPWTHKHLAQNVPYILLIWLGLGNATTLGFLTPPNCSNCTLKEKLGDIEKKNVWKNWWLVQRTWEAKALGWHWNRVWSFINV